MKLMVDKMRADFAAVAAARMQAGAWERGDEAAAGQAIAKLVHEANEEGVLIWARWLAKLALQDLMLDAKEPVPAPVARLCANCRHFATPGRSEGYCGGRDDLAKAYGKNHPLHLLPADGGASCARFAKAEQ